MLVYRVAVNFTLLVSFLSRLDGHPMTIRDLYHFHTVEILMEVAAQELKMIIKWAKQLSSFNALDVDDQINLLSEGRTQ